MDDLKIIRKKLLRFDKIVIAILVVLTIIVFIFDYKYIYIFAVFGGWIVPRLMFELSLRRLKNAKKDEIYKSYLFLNVFIYFILFVFFFYFSFGAFLVCFFTLYIYRITFLGSLRKFTNY